MVLWAVWLALTNERTWIWVRWRALGESFALSSLKRKDTMDQTAMQSAGMRSWARKVDGQRWIQAEVTLAGGCTNLFSTVIC